MSRDFADHLKDRQALIDEHLGRHLRRAGDAPPPLMEAMRYSLLAPGKKLRPMLVLFAGEAAGGTADDALPAGCAVEMVHTYSLIHDDLPAMDDDDLRRGQPTCHVKFGEALAVLAGDALLTLAFQVLAEAYPPATAAACCRELAAGAGAAGMVGGQTDDLAAESRLPGEWNSGCRLGKDLRSLEQIHSRKTGALYRTCLRLGLYAAQGERAGGPDRDLLARLDAFGRAFGLAFQITDDLLDVESTSERAGKRVGKDAARGKLTYPGLLGIAESRARARALYAEAIDALKPLGPPAGHLADLARYVIERDR